MNEYNFHALVHNGYIYVEAQKCMYGLPQAGLLDNILLAKRLAKHGYSPVPPPHRDYGCTSGVPLDFH
jgi:hypothetical protein